jgi:GNAT superfamily N-acetyltransferase
MTPTTLPDDTIRMHWADEPALAGQIADFFCEHSDPAYISHSELQSGRALAAGEWNPDLHRIMLAQAGDVLAESMHDGKTDEIACAWRGAELVGIALVSFDGVDPDRRFAVLDDLIVSSAVRGVGLGRQFVEWIADRVREVGIPRLYLESGIQNADGHRFFERAGFQQISIVMMRDL